MFSWEFCEISKNTFFVEHLWWLLLTITLTRGSCKLKGAAWWLDGRFGWAFYCKLNIWFLKIIWLFTISLNFTFKIKQERLLSSKATISPKILSSPFCTFPEEIVNFSWRCLLIVLKTFAESFCWMVSFSPCLSDELAPYWTRFLLELSLGWSCLDSSFSWWIALMHLTLRLTLYLHQKSQVFHYFIFLIAAIIYVVIVIL